MEVIAYPPPDLARWPHSRAPFSVSPITSARLVNCQAGSGCAGVNAKEALCFSGGFPTEPDAPLSHSWATFSVSPTRWHCTWGQLSYGASAIPTDLKEACDVFHLSPVEH